MINRVKRKRGEREEEGGGGREKAQQREERSLVRKMAGEHVKRHKSSEMMAGGEKVTEVSRTSLRSLLGSSSTWTSGPANEINHCCDVRTGFSWRLITGSRS